VQEKTAAYRLIFIASAGDLSVGVLVGIAPQRTIRAVLEISTNSNLRDTLETKANEKYKFNIYKENIPFLSIKINSDL